MTPWWHTDRPETPGAWDEKNTAAMFDPSGIVTNTRERELEDLARLGPLVRKALHECMILWSAADILLEFERRGWRVRRDDAKMAAIVKRVDGMNHKEASCFARSQDDQGLAW
jgi:hypothetical protein